MKNGDLVKFNESMVLYYASLGREDLAQEARDLTMMVIDTMTFSENDETFKLVTCLTTSEQGTETADIHSTDLVVLQKTC